MTPGQLLEQINEVARQSEVERLYFDSARANEDKLLELQKEQLSKGEDQTGSIVGRYSPFTEELAKQEDPIKPKVAGQPYNFEWTGDFFAQMFVRFAQRQLTLTSAKRIVLQTFEDFPLFGLQPRNLERFHDERQLKSFNNAIRRRLGLTTK